ncbi:MAG: hypothetical protein WAM14_08730 [Candidatus Nitrosopolaris sp.]
MKTSERGLNSSKTIDYVYDEVSKLIMNNYEEGIDNVYGRAKDNAYRDVLAILTRILNK